jgi:carboxyl-terminal processing protease
VTVKVNGQQRSFPIERVDAPWSLRSMLQEIFRFVQPNLQPVPDKEESRRLVEIEMAATNGMLYTLDPHSVLLDVETYKDMRTQTQGKFGGLGIVIEMDKKNRITVKRPMPETPAIRVGIKAKDHIVRINNESTVNMTLNEAVERLRGDIGTNVDVYIERDASPGVKKFTITRASIRPPAIGARPGSDQGRLLPHAALLRQQRRRPVGRAVAVRTREGQGHHHGPAGQPGRPV